MEIWITLLCVLQTLLFIFDVICLTRLIYLKNKILRYQMIEGESNDIQLIKANNSNNKDNPIDESNNSNKLNGLLSNSMNSKHDYSMLNSKGFIKPNDEDHTQGFRPNSNQLRKSFGASTFFQSNGKDLSFGSNYQNLPGENRNFIVNIDKDENNLSNNLLSTKNLLLNSINETDNNEAMNRNKNKFIIGLETYHYIGPIVLCRKPETLTNYKKGFINCSCYLIFSFCVTLVVGQMTSGNSEDNSILKIVYIVVIMVLCSLMISIFICYINHLKSQYNLEQKNLIINELITENEYSIKEIRKKIKISLDAMQIGFFGEILQGILFIICCGCFVINLYCIYLLQNNQALIALIGIIIGFIIDLLVIRNLFILIVVVFTKCLKKNMPSGGSNFDEIDNAKIIKKNIQRLKHLEKSINLNGTSSNRLQLLLKGGHLDPSILELSNEKSISGFHKHHFIGEEDYQNNPHVDGEADDGNVDEAAEGDNTVERDENGQPIKTNVIKIPSGKKTKTGNALYNNMNIKRKLEQEFMHSQITEKTENDEVKSSMSKGDEHEIPSTARKIIPNEYSGNEEHDYNNLIDDQNSNNPHDNINDYGNSSAFRSNSEAKHTLLGGEGGGEHNEIDESGRVMIGGAIVAGVMFANKKDMLHDGDDHHQSRNLIGEVGDQRNMFNETEATETKNGIIHTGGERKPLSKTSEIDDSVDSRNGGHNRSLRKNHDGKALGDRNLINGENLVYAGNIIDDNSKSSKTQGNQDLNESKHHHGHGNRENQNTSQRKSGIFGSDMSHYDGKENDMDEGMDRGSSIRSSIQDPIQEGIILNGILNEGSTNNDKHHHHKNSIMGSSPRINTDNKSSNFTGVSPNKTIGEDVIILQSIEKDNGNGNKQMNRQDSLNQNQIKDQNLRNNFMSPGKEMNSMSKQDSINQSLQKGNQSPQKGNKSLLTSNQSLLKSNQSLLKGNQSLKKNLSMSDSPNNRTDLLLRKDSIAQSPVFLNKNLLGHQSPKKDSEDSKYHKKGSKSNSYSSKGDTKEDKKLKSSNDGLLTGEFFTLKTSDKGPITEQSEDDENTFDLVLDQGENFENEANHSDFRNSSFNSIQMGSSLHKNDTDNESFSILEINDAILTNQNSKNTHGDNTRKNSINGEYSFIDEKRDPNEIRSNLTRLDKNPLTKNKSKLNQPSTSNASGQKTKKKGNGRPPIERVQSKIRANDIIKVFSPGLDITKGKKGKQSNSPSDGSDSKQQKGQSKKRLGSNNEDNKQPISAESRYLNYTKNISESLKTLPKDHKKFLNSKNDNKLDKSQRSLSESVLSKTNRKVSNGSGNTGTTGASGASGNSKSNKTKGNKSIQKKKHRRQHDSIDMLRRNRSFDDLFEHSPKISKFHKDCVVMNDSKISTLGKSKRNRSFDNLFDHRVHKRRYKKYLTKKTHKKLRDIYGLNSDVVILEADNETSFQYSIPNNKTNHNMSSMMFGQNHRTNKHLDDLKASLDSSQYSRLNLMLSKLPDISRRPLHKPGDYTQRSRELSKHMIGDSPYLEYLPDLIKKEEISMMKKKDESKGSLINEDETFKRARKIKEINDLYGGSSKKRTSSTKK